MSSSADYYNLNTASPQGLLRLQEWSEPFRPNKKAWGAHVIFSALELIMGPAFVLLEQNGTSLFGRWTTVQKCAFVVFQLIVVFFLFVHRKSVNRKEWLAPILGIKEYCRRNLSNDQYTIVQKDKATYVFTNSIVRSHSQFMEERNNNRFVNTYVAFDSLIKDKKE